METWYRGLSMLRTLVMILAGLVSMAHFPPEILEQILIRLKVRDLIRCKCVSKSWLSLISDPRFIKAHLKHSYDRDRNDEEIGGRRIVMSRDLCFNIYQTFEVDDGFFSLNKCHLLGSSDGLVCISPSYAQILVVNSSTREVKKLTKPQIPETGYFCWGFGYDASTDDYKVVLGCMTREKVTCFQVFSLRSNMWKVIEEISYHFRSRVGILCKGALHWVAYHTSSSTENVILSFNLSEEKFVEVPQPDDVSYQSRLARHLFLRLGTIKDCLCVFRYAYHLNDLWVMKGYNGKQSWQILGPEREIKYEVVHTIKQLRNYIPNKKPLCYAPYLLQSDIFTGSPIYVESLVSPHFHRRPRRRRQTTNTMRSARVKPNNYGVASYAVPRADDGTSSGDRAGV